MRGLFDGDNERQREPDDFNSTSSGVLETNGEAEHRATVILNGMNLTGQVDGTHDFFLYGGFEGKINISRLLKVGQTGQLKGEVKAKVVIIEGKFDGKVTAEERLELSDTGHFKGDIVTPSLLVSDKAFFQGKVTMVREEQKQQPVLPLQEIAQVEVVDDLADESIEEEVDDVDLDEVENEIDEVEVDN